VTGPGMFAPVVIANQVTALGRGVMPSVRVYRFDELSGGAHDSQWVAIRGIVRSSTVKPSWGRPVLFLEMGIDGGNLITVRVHDFPAAGWSGLTGSLVLVHGVCGTVFNDRRQFTGLRLFVASLSGLKVEIPAPGDPFDAPLRPLDNLMKFGNQREFVRPIKVTGVVTYSRPGQEIYIQDGSVGLLMHSSQTTRVPLGSRIEAVGYPAVGRYSPTLENVRYRLTGAEPPLRGLPRGVSEMVVDKDGFQSAPYDSLLVRLRGVFIEEISGPEDDLLFFRDGASTFRATLSRSEQNHIALAPGSLIEVTGVCVARVNRAQEIRSFDILLRSPGDLVVLKHGPWWTAAHAMFVVAFLAASLLLIASLLFIVRRQARLRMLALTDPLSGLYNCRGFLLLAEHQWQLALRKDAALFLLYIDLDKFKEINDSLGHKTGDLALQAAADVLRECFRKTDLIGRLRGDEFAVAAVDAHPQSREQLERRLDKIVDEANRKPGRTFRLSLSVGVLLCDASLRGSTIEDLLAKADSLMYEKKAIRKSSSHRAPSLSAII
jgi:diguanylate cyclase (GGDEF)-like protein